jgi:MFS family permease
MSSSPYASLAIHDYRLLLAGRLFVSLALQIQGMAVGWQIFQLTHDALYLGLAGLSEAIPAIGIALYAGHVADIVDRKKIAITSIVTLIFILALLTFCSNQFATHKLLVWIIFAVIALSGFVRGFYGPAVFGMLGDIVPRELYGNASAWNSAVWQSSAVAGPILGGYLYLTLGATNTYAFCTVLAVGSFLCFCFVKSKTTLAAGDKPAAWENIKEGLKFVFSNQIILAAMALDLFAVLFGGAVALLPIFASQIFHLGPQALGVLRAAPSIGALLTAGILTHRPIAKYAGAIFMAAAAGFGMCMIAFGLSTNFYLSLFLLAVSGMLDGISVWVRSTIYQLCTPDEMKGRVSAVNNIFIGSSNEIGEFESGVTAKWMGLVTSVVFGGCMTLLVVIYTAFKAPKLRRLDMRTLYKTQTAKST